MAPLVGRGRRSEVPGSSKESVSYGSYNWSKIDQKHVDSYAFFHVHCSTKSQKIPTCPKF